MKKNDLYLLLIIIVAIFVVSKIAIYFSEFHLTAKFNTLTPLHGKTNVVLKGVQIGEVEKVHLTKDIKYTLVEIKLYKKYELPVGTVAKLKENVLEQTYIELKVPEKQTNLIIKEYKTIPGDISANARALLEKHLESGTLDSMVGSAKDAMSNANNISANLNEATELAVEILVENRENISDAIKNFSKTSQNIEKFTGNLNLLLEDGTINEEVKKTIRHLANTMANVEKISGQKGFTTSAENIQESTQSLKQMMKNFEDSSKNIKDVTEELDTTLKKTHCILDEGIMTAKSVQHLTSGLSETISERFLFFKLMFGQPGDSLENPPKKYCTKYAKKD